MELPPDKNYATSQLIAAREVAKILNCAPDYVGRLCREGKLEGQLIDNVWHVEQASISSYQKVREALRIARAAKLATERRAQIRNYRYAKSGPLGRLKFAIWENHRFALASLVVGFSLLAATTAVVQAMSGGTFATAQTAALGHVESPFFNSQVPPLDLAKLGGSVQQFFASLFTPQSPKQVATQASTSTVSVAQTATTSVAVSGKPAPTTIINNTYPVTERVIEHTSTQTVSGVSQDYVDQALNALRSQIASVSSGSAGAFIPYAPATRIDKLSSVTITGSNISGGSISSVSLNAPDLAGVVAIANGGTGTSSAPGYGKVLLGNTAGGYDLVATSTLGISGVSTFKGLSDVPSTISAGDLLYGSSSSTLVALPIGANGQVLKITSGLPAWGTDLQGSGGAGAWATTTDSLAVYTADPTQVVIVGNNATTTTGNILEVTGNALFRNLLTAYKTVTAPTFTATSTLAASVFPYASSTAFTVSGTGYFGTASTTDLTVSSVANGLLATNNGGVAQAASVSAPLAFSGTTLSITQATTGTNGYLSSADFATFNNKISSTSLSGGVGISYNSATGVIANTVGYLFPSNATTTQLAFNGGATFAGATTTALAVTGSTTIAGQFNATGGATFGNATVGSLTLGSALTVANGGTGSTTLGGLLTGNGTGVLTSAIVSAPLTFTGNTLAITQATTGTSGYLSSADFATFNNKISSTSLSASYPLVYNSSTGVFSSALATTSTNTWVHQIFTSLFATDASSTNATSTNFFATSLNATNATTTNLSTTIASTTNLTISGLGNGSTQCLQINGSGTVSATGSACGAGSSNFGYLFPSDATTTQLAFNGGLTAATILATGSTTLQNVTAINATTSQATTTNLAIVSVTGSLLKTLASGAVVAAQAGVDYQAAGNYANFGYLFPSNATTTQLAFNGGATFAGATTTALEISSLASTSNLVISSLGGAGTTCVQADANGMLSSTGAACGSGSGAVNAVSNSDGTLTISPTTGSVVASLNLAHANTFSALQQFGAGASTTNLVLSSAPSCSSTQALTTDPSGNVVCGTLATGVSLSAANTWTALQSFAAGASTTQMSVTGRAYFGGTSTTTIDSTGAITVTSGLPNTFPFASSTALTVSGGLYTSVASSLLKTDTAGKLTAAVAGTDYDTFAWPFTSTTNYGATANSTSTPVWFTAGVQASSTSHFAAADFSSAITSTANTANILPFASTTALTVSGSLYGAGLSTCNTSADKLLWGGGTFSCGTDVSGSGGTDVNWVYFNGSGIRVSTSSNQVLIGGTSTSTLAQLEVHGGANFDSATTTALSVSGIASFAGTVGIGTTTPAAQLAVSGGTILQVANGNPTLAATVATSSTTHSYASVVSGRYLYSADYEAGLRIIDISNPKSPTVVGSYNTSMTQARTVAVAGKYAYVGDQTAGLVILDVSNPSAPQLVGTYAGINAYGIALSGRYALLTDKSSANMRIIDVSNPTAPRLVGSYQPNVGSQPVSVAVQGKYAYMGDYGNSAIYIVDISNPASPSTVGSYVGNSPTGLYVSGKYLYVADNNGGFYIVNISNPASPSLVGTYNGTAQYYGVQVAGDYAYVADHAGNLTVIDVHAPASPSLVGTIAVGDTPNGVTVSGKYAYVAANGNSEKVVDINGAQLPAASIGSIEGNTANISDNLTVGGDVSLGGGLDVGISGIFSRGTIAAYVASSTQVNPTVASFIGGNVGIGTTSPYATLSVVGSSGVVADHYTATSTTASLFQGGFLALASSTIGNGTQTGGLTISGGATTTGRSYINDSAGSATDNVLTINAPSSYTGNWLNLQSNGTSAFQITEAFNTDHYEPLLYNPDASNSGQNAAIRLGNQSGYLRIIPYTNNTTYFQSSLGNLQFSGNNGAAGTTLTFNYADTDFLGGVSAVDGGSNGQLRLLSSGGSNFVQSGLTATLNSAAPLIFGTMFNGTEWARFSSTGQFGIGTSSPFAKFSIAANNGDTNTTLFAIGSSTASATSTLFSVSNTGSTTLFQLPSSILKTTSDGTIVAAVAGTDYVTGTGLASAFPFTPTANFGATVNATTTAIWFQNGLQASSTARLSDISTIGTIDFATTSANAYAKLITFGGTAFLTASSTGFNTGLGLSALSAITSGSQNTALGYQALQNATSSQNSIGIGYQALQGNASEANFSQDIAVGNGALQFNKGVDATAGNSDQNVAIGQNALHFNTTSSFNIALGGSALYQNTTGGSNIAIGIASLNVNTTGNNSVAIGYSTLSNANGGDNTAVGHAAMNSDTTGTQNVAMGEQALASNITGSKNVAIGGGVYGDSVLWYNTSATSTVAVGYDAGRGTANYHNQGSTLLGYQSGFSNSTGSDYNTLLGYQSGYNITTGANNIILGAYVDAPSNTGNQQLNIGNVLYGTGLYNGGLMSSAPVLNGNIGIGTTSPFAKLSVHANNGDINTTLFAIGSSTAAATSTLFSVSNTGSTTLFQLPSSILKTNANGTIVAAVAGTDYVTPSALTAATVFPFTPTTFGSTAANATSTLIGFTNGLYALASSTIGDGTQTGGLTVNGGATTTLDQYIGGVLTVNGTASSSFAGNITAAANKNLVIAQGDGNFYTLINPYLSGANRVQLAIGTSTPNVNVASYQYSTIVSKGLYADGIGINTTLDPNSNGLIVQSTGCGCTATSSAAYFYGRVNSTGSLVAIDSTENFTTTGALRITGNSGRVESLYVSSNGLTGLGTTSPFAKLSIQANNGDTNTTLFAIGSSTASATTSLFTVDNQGNTSITGGLGVGTAANPNAYEMIVNGAISASALYDLNGGSWFVDPAGDGDQVGRGYPISATLASNVGIGTSTPSSKLVVNAAFGDTNANLFVISSSTSSGTTQFLTISKAGLTDFNPANNTGDKVFTLGGTSFLAASSTGQNTILGIGAGAANVVGSGLTAFGYNALAAATSSSGDTAIGEGALAALSRAHGGTSSTFNTAIGYQALTAASDATNNTQNNVAVGASAGSGVTGGADNILLGYRSMYTGNGHASSNIALGTQTLYSYTGYGSNVVMGTYGGYNLTSGTDNILLGVHSNTSSSNLTTGSHNISIGNYLSLPSATADGQLDIQNILFGTNNSASGFVPSTGQLGVGTSTPFARFAIGANDGDTNTTLFAIGSSTVSATSTLFSVSNTGSTTLFQLPSSILKTNANGTIIAAVAGTDYVTGTGLASAFPFTPTTNFGVTANATSTAIWFQNGLQASSTARLSDISTIGTIDFATTSANAYAKLLTLSGTSFLTASTTGFSTGLGVSALASNISGVDNNAFGYQALQNATSTSDNIAIGYLALRGDSTNFTGNQNIALGTGVLESDTTGGNNVGIGHQALLYNTTGLGNIALGYQAMALNSTGAGNIAIGFSTNVTASSGNFNTSVGNSAGGGSTGSSNTAIGSGALSANRTGNNNFAGGAAALQNASTTSDNTAVGFQALQGSTVGSLAITGTQNVAVGGNALKNFISMNGSVAVGYNALTLATSTLNDTAVGYSALGSQTTQNTTSTENTAIGYNAMGSANGALQSVALGAWAGTGLVGGYDNVAIGYRTLFTTNSAAGNTAIGYEALTALNNNAAANNTAVGHLAGVAVTSGASNVLLGTYAGASLTTGSNNILIGTNIDAPSITGSQQLNIGNLLFGTNIYNGASVSAAPVGGQVGIGTTSPFARFAIQANSGDTNTTLFAIGSSTSNSTTTLFKISNIGVADFNPANNTGDKVFTLGGTSFLTASSTGGNVSLGTGALALITNGTNNTALGVNALAAQATGADNTALGAGAMQFNDGAARSVGIGSAALQFGGSGNGANVGIGYDSLRGGGAGGWNTAVGYSGGYSVTGAFNIILGAFPNTGDNITAGNNNIVIGNNTSVATSTYSNSLNIQNILFGTNNSGSGITPSTGQIGIGTSTPWARFSISANNGDTNTMLFAIASSTASATTTLFSVSNTGLATLSSLLSIGSSTIGNGSQNGGLTISGGATTTGNAYFGGNVGIGTTTPWGSFSLMPHSGQTNPLFVVASTTGATSTPYFNITAAGNVGVGTDAPGALLEVGAQNPVKRGTLTNNDSRVVTVRGNYAYVSAYIPGDGVSEFAIVDISNPDQPKLIGSTGVGSSVQGIALQGMYAYAADISGIHIIDISKPKNPTQVSVIDTSGANFYAVTVSGNYVYAESNNGIEVIDVSNPLIPVSKGFVSGSGGAGAVQVKIQGRYLYEVNGGNLKIWDISSPISPTLVATVTDATYLAAPVDIQVVGRYAYVVNQTSSNTTACLTTVDVSDAVNAAVVGHICGVNGPNYLSQASGISVQGKYAYVNASGNNSLTVINIASSTNPTFAASTKMFTNTFTTGHSSSIAVVGKYAYIAKDDENQFAIADISGIETPGINAGSVLTTNLQVSGNGSIANSFDIGGGLSVGQGGIFSNGSLVLQSNVGSLASSFTVASSSGASQFTINGKGNVGIGTSTPWATLTVALGSTTPGFAVAAAGSSTPAFFVSSANQNGYVGIGTSTNNLATSSVLAVGNSTISSGNTIAVFSNAGGAAYLSNLGLSVSSDQRLKKNINPLVSALSGVLALQPVTYNFNSEADGSQVHTGFVAQQAQPIFPDLVQTNGQGYLSFNYGGLTPYLASAIQAQQGEILGIASSSATFAQMTIQNGLVTIGTGATSTVALSAGQVSLGETSTSVVTINAGTVNFSNPATTTIAVGDNVWTIATSTATGTLPIVSISVPASSTPSVSINGNFILNGQDVSSIASTSATTTPDALVQGPFAAATDALKNAVTTAYGAVQNVAQTGVRQLGAAVYATVGSFNQLFTQTLTATDITADTVTATQKLCVGTTCVTEQQLQQLLSGQNNAGGSTGAATNGGGATSTASTTAAASTASSTPTTPPTISINGNNPATITVGTTYGDLGATATDVQGHSLTVHTFVNGAAMDPVIIDTSAVATSTIDYVATDTWGNTATSTRTVIINQ